ncbi:MAG: hypothetical protein QM499_00890 [Flavobacteriaceae bacterium]
MMPNVIFFETVLKTNVVMLKNPSKRKLFYPPSNKSKAGKVRKIEPIMYSKEYDTIIVKELKEIDADVKPTSLSTRKGQFRVQEDDIYLLEYLRGSEQNVANGGKMFREVDVQKEEAFQLDGYAAYDKAIYAVMNADNEQAKSLAMTFISPTAVNKSVQKIKLELRRMLGSSDDLVTKVNNYLDANIAEERLLIATAMDENIFSLVGGRKFTWEQTKEVFFVASQSAIASDELALWLKNDDEGRQYLKSITEKVAEVKK